MFVKAFNIKTGSYRKTGITGDAIGGEEAVPGGVNNVPGGIFWAGLNDGCKDWAAII